MKNYKISILRAICQTLYLVVFIFALLSKNVIFIFIIASAVLLGPIFCGWMCFFGFYQDISRYIGSRFKKTPLEIDGKIHKYLRFSRYIIFFLATYVGGVFLFSDNIKNSLGGILHSHFVINLAFWGVIFIGILSLFTKRFYCRYLCTFGSKLSLFSIFRPITIIRDKDACINCGACSRECLMHIDVKNTESLANPTCINCFKCIENCPKKCLKLGLRNYFKI